MAWSRRRVVAVISGPGRAGQYQVPSDEDGSAGVCLDAELVVAVVHDRPVAQGPGGEVEALGEGLGAGAVVAEPPGPWYHQSQWTSVLKLLDSGTGIHYPSLKAELDTLATSLTQTIDAQRH